MHEFNNELMKIKVLKDEYDSELLKEEAGRKPKESEKSKIDPKTLAHSVVQKELEK